MGMQCETSKGSRGNPKGIRTKALLAVILGNSIFGFSFLFSKTALSMTIPSAMLAIRFTSAFLVLNLLVAMGRILKKKDGQPLIAFSLKGKPLKYILALAIFQPVIYFFAESYGITFTSSAFAGVIIAVVPVVGILLDVLILHTHVVKKQVSGAICSVLGVVLTTLGAADMKSSRLGVVLLLIAVLAGALFYVFSKKAGEHFNPLERTYVMFGIGSVTYLCLALFQCRGQYDKLLLAPLSSGIFWGCILYLSVISSVVAFMLLNFGSSYVSVSEASIFANLTTVISIVAGVVILREAFTLRQVIGAVIILISVYVASVGNEGK